MTVKTLSSEDAGIHWPDVIDEVTSGKAEIVIERYGKPTVAVISYKEYLRIQHEREKRRVKLAKMHTEMEAGHYMTWEQVEAELKAKGLL